MIMTMLFGWPCVSIKRGANILVLKMVIKAVYSWMFGHLLTTIKNDFFTSS